jgi:hypothetical protein
MMLCTGWPQLPLLTLQTVRVEVNGRVEVKVEGWLRIINRQLMSLVWYC